MLIFTRRVGTTVMVGDDVTLTILAIKGNRVRVGITAPKNVAVYREELQERTTREGSSASSEQSVSPPGA
jgi:carbon storage regulator